jgi:hypothetical protein
LEFSVLKVCKVFEKQQRAMQQIFKQTFSPRISMTETHLSPPTATVIEKHDHKTREQLVHERYVGPQTKQEPLANAPPHSAFTQGEKQWISSAVSFSTMFSAMSGLIYYPVLVPVARDLGVSVSLINLTVTSYFVMAAVAPAFMGDMADQSGRRPVLLLLFVLMTAANVGIALQRSFAALLVLRMVQSAGASGEERENGRMGRVLSRKGLRLTTCIPSRALEHHIRCHRGHHGAKGERRLCRDLVSLVSRTALAASSCPLLLFPSTSRHAFPLFPHVAPTVEKGSHPGFHPAPQSPPVSAP